MSFKAKIYDFRFLYKILVSYMCLSSGLDIEIEFTIIGYSVVRPN